MTPWQIPVFTRVLAAHIISPVLTKKLAGERSRTRSLRLMFLLCALFAGTLAMLFGRPIVFTTGLFLVICLGMANSFGAYSMWRAQAISLSRQALFTFVDDLIPVVMAYFLLGESKVFSPWLTVGVVVCVGSCIAYSVIESRKKADSEQGKRDGSPFAIFVWIGIYSVIWGLANFAFRYFALAGMSPMTFLVGWYGGSFLGANVVALLAGKKELGKPLEKKQIALVAANAVIAFVCLGLEYWACMCAPLAVTQPIFQVTEMIFPVLVGLFVFKEVKQLTKNTKFIFVLAFAGSLIIAVSH